MKTRITAILVLMCLIAGMIPMALAASSTSDSYDDIKHAIIGETITLGVYEQDNNGKDGPEAIEWIVLDKVKGRMLVISKYALTARPYNDDRTRSTWADSSIRSWLNDDFICDAFTAEELDMVLFTDVDADANGQFGTNPGAETLDRIFLLSVPEALRYFANITATQCTPTKYALACGAYTNGTDKHDGIPTVSWWLRTPGENSYCAAMVNYRGGVDTHGDEVQTGCRGIRPAMWLDISK